MIYLLNWSTLGLGPHPEWLALIHLSSREIQLQQMKSASSWDDDGDILTAILQSSFTLPFLVVVFVAILLLACRQRRPHHYNVSRNSSYLNFFKFNNSTHSTPLMRSASQLNLTRNGTQNQLGLSRNASQANLGRKNSYQLSIGRTTRSHSRNSSMSRINGIV